MSKSAIFTTAYAVAKESWDHFSEGVDFMEHIKNHLGHQLAERIFQECQSGEKIVTVGNIYEKEIHETNQVEIREKVSLEDLVRCKDCVYCWKFNDKFYLPKKDSLICINDCDVEVHADDFCSWGERRSE